MTTTQKCPPSLNRGDYYTKKDYALLKSLIVNNTSLPYLILVNALEKPNPKRSVKGIALHSYEQSFWKIMYDTPLGDIPMYLNIDYLLPLCQWRLQINK